MRDNLTQKFPSLRIVFKNANGYYYHLNKHSLPVLYEEVRSYIVTYYFRN